jgi:hypothetical protein
MKMALADYLDGEILENVSETINNNTVGVSSKRWPVCHDNKFISV